MKICHITSAHSRYDIRIFKKECVSLAKAGYEVYLLVNDSKDNEINNGVNIISSGFNPKNRYERFLKSSSTLLEEALKISADVYHLHDPEIMSLIKPLKKSGKIVIFDAHEDSEQQIKDKTWIPSFLRNIVSKIYACYSHNLITKASGVISVTPSLVEKLKKYNKNTIMVTNYPILNNLDIDNCEKENIIFFGGGISSQWNLLQIAKALKKLNKIDFYIAGKITQKEYFDKVCDEGGERVKYLGFVSQETVLDYYRKSIAGMSLLKCSQVGNEGTLGNTKLFEIIQAGVPVICSDLNLWKKIIEKYKCGICVDPDNIEQIADALSYLYSNPEISRQMGENGKNAIKEEFNWNTQEKILLKFYKDMLNQKDEV